MAMGNELKRAALGAIMLVLCAAAATAQDNQKEPDRTGGPYVPTPQVVVDEMLRMAGVKANDFVMDLGSGDGVIVLTAAQQFKARGMGIEIDPELVKLSNDTARRLGVADRASFQVLDVFKADLSRATVLTLYLLPSMMSNLQSKVFQELKPGARVVSHDYNFGDDWRPDDYLTFDVPEKEKVNGVPRATIYLWIVPAKIAGKWRLTIEGTPAGQYDLVLRQQFQAFAGSATAGGKSTKLELSSLRGEEIRFAVNAGAGRHVFSGRVSGNRMEGKVELGTGKGAARWTATRVGA
ncbi:MAG: methyltransferase domain-containing protein [Betaproteobacteria bacterium]|nr:methyltransferase domain-containing protein [Betaproteobacteria bacterium]